MKRFIAILLIAFILCGLTACDARKEKVKEENASRQLADMGFEVVKYLGAYGDCDAYLVYDVETKVEYIFAWGYCRTSWSPYYDDTGNVAFYDGGE